VAAAGRLSYHDFVVDRVAACNTMVDLRGEWVRHKVLNSEFATRLALAGSEVIDIYAA